jgi:transcriptional regulator with XRE-family HTH domain
VQGEDRRASRATPKRLQRTGRGREPAPGAEFVPRVLADNVRAWRQIRNLTQEQLATGMRARGHGHEWSASVVGFVERGDRTVSVDELVSLSIELDVGSPGALLDPGGPDGRRKLAIDYGVGLVIPSAIARPWLRGQIECRFEGGALVGIEPVSGHDAEYTKALASFEAGEHVRVTSHAIPPKRDPSETPRVRRKRRRSQEGEER